MDLIEATLNHIRFQNDRGFLIGMFQSEKNEFAGLGNILRPEIGMSYKLMGKWSIDPSGGSNSKSKRTRP